MAASGKNWYVFRAVSGKELKVKEYIEAELKVDTMLASHVFEVLVPMEQHVTMRNGKRVPKAKTRLSGYVFVRADLNGEIAHTLRFTPNVLGILGGLDEPTPVPDAEINRMIGAAEETLVQDEVEIPYMLDETVKVTDGPFSGFSGVIKDINTETHKLKVTVKIFGRETPLELSFAQVEKEG